MRSGKRPDSSLIGQSPCSRVSLEKHSEWALFGFCFQIVCYSLFQHRLNPDEVWLAVVPGPANEDFSFGVISFAVNVLRRIPQLFEASVSVIFVNTMVSPGYPSLSLVGWATRRLYLRRLYLVPRIRANHMEVVCHVPKTIRTATR